jgi:two-component system, chemotaxis family, CheB/CheR fusion protein
MNPPQQIRSLRVLAVDDSRDTADSFCLLLAAWGHNPLVAYDASTALETALRERPDVVLLDLDLPGGMDGWDLARRLRTEPSLRGIVLIAVSGYGSEADRRKSQDAGIDEHLLKPFDPEVLRRLLACGLWPERDSVDKVAAPAPAATGGGR